jgi:ABC-2 type transport system ATP-binding protein
MDDLQRPPLTRDPVIELRGVEKRYDTHLAVRGLDLVIPRGSTYGLLGPNGAGKTTTIRMILGIIEPSAGDIKVFGRPLDLRALDRIGYLPEERGLYRRMTVRKVLVFLAELKGLRKRDVVPRIDWWLERMGLGERANARVQELSKGMQQKVQFIASVLHNPELVILDEPFSGLDPINQQVLKEIVLDLQKAGHTIVFSTHMIDQAERTCDHVCIIARGQKVVDGTMAQVKKREGGENVAIVVDRWTDAGRRVMTEHAGIAHVRVEGTDAEIMLHIGARSSELLKDLVASEVSIRRFERVEPSLEQIFIEKAGPLASPDEIRTVAHV